MVTEKLFYCLALFSTPPLLNVSASRVLIENVREQKTNSLYGKRYNITVHIKYFYKWRIHAVEIHEEIHVIY